jgi:RNA recognition motif-containing protein
MGKRIYVGNLPFGVDEARLKELFAQHGEVSEVSVIRDRFTDQPKGFAFVEMATDGDAQKAISALDGTEMDGRQVKVNEAREREGGGTGGGGGGGRGRY